MDFSAFDNSKLEQYAAEAKARWGKTGAWQEYEEKAKAQTPAEQQDAARALMAVFREMGTIRHLPPEGPEAQVLVEQIRSCITRNYYTCTPEILRSLGQMYEAGGDMTENIDAAGGPGTARFAARAIEAWCGK